MRRVAAECYVERSTRIDRALLLGATPVAQFDCRRRAASGAWADLVGGITVLSPTNPTGFAADGTKFLGWPVVETVATISYLRLLSPALLLSGDSPYLFCVVRVTTWPVANGEVVRILNAGGSANSLALLASAGTLLNGLIEAGAATATFSDTASIHTLETYIEAGVCKLRIDGGAPQTNGVGISLLSNSGHLSFGAAHTGTLGCSAFHAKHILCRAKPSEAACAGLRANARRDFAF